MAHAAAVIATGLDALKRRAEVVPQGEGMEELIAIRKLLRLGRPEEALERFDTWLDRNVHTWRVGLQERVR